MQILKVPQGLHFINRSRDTQFGRLYGNRIFRSQVPHGLSGGAFHYRMLKHTVNKALSLRDNQKQDEDFSK
jgi:hypothetical protein